MAEGAVRLEFTSGGTTTVLSPYNADVDNPVMLVSKPLDMGQTDLQKYVDGLVAEFSEIANTTMLQLDIGWKDRMNADTNWLTQMSLTSADEMAHFSLNARYVVVKLTDETPNDRWYLTGMELYGRVGRGNQ